MKVALAAMATLGFALQQHVIVDTLWPPLRRRYALAKFSRLTQTLVEYALRTTLVALECMCVDK